jgi:single-strand DNA-binding protein
MNKLTLIGNLTHDPETRQTPSGATVCTFTIAVNRRFPVNGERVTDFFRINAWRQLGDTCQKWLAKGRRVAVIGELQPRQYEANDGSTKMSLDVSADEVEFLSPRGEGDAPREEPKPQTENPLGTEQPGSEDDMPF